MTHSREKSKGDRRFSLFSAFNGLLERAKSSAEQESQRLFTSPSKPIKKKKIPSKRKQHELVSPRPKRPKSREPSVTSSVLPVPLSAMTLQSTTSTTTAVSETPLPPPPPPPLSSFPPAVSEQPAKMENSMMENSMVERKRLEKVERELHRLKKIIASLLPDELNEDDLRSVYRGEADGDVVARLMRIQRQGQERRDRLMRFNGIPQAPPPPPPPPPPAAPVAPPVAPPPPPPPPPPPMTTPPVTSQKQQALASIISQKPTKPLKRRPTVVKQPKQPKTDPGIMSQLLEEMKHHRLRSVRKPRDM